MADMLTHEELFRGKDIYKIKGYTFWIGGFGALGSNVADGLARHGATKFVVVDDDRVENSNLGTQPWFLEEVGMRKVDAGAKRLYRVNKSVVVPMPIRFEPDRLNKFKIKDPKTIVIDMFDNFPTRRLVKDFYKDGNGEACIHAGMSGDGFGEVVWDEEYKIIDISKKENQVDVCEYPLARNLVLFIATLCVDAIIEYVTVGKKANYNFTLFDKNIRKWYV
jgi:molybdopterin-synthase adenylyltransferase